MIYAIFDTHIETDLETFRMDDGFSNSGIRRAEAWNDDSPPPPPPRPPRLALRILCIFHL